MPLHEEAQDDAMYEELYDRRIPNDKYPSFKLIRIVVPVSMLKVRWRWADQHCGS